MFTCCLIQIQFFFKCGKFGWNSNSILLSTWYLSDLLCELFNYNIYYFPRDDRAILRCHSYHTSYSYHNNHIFHIYLFSRNNRAITPLKPHCSTIPHIAYILINYVFPRDDRAILLYLSYPMSLPTTSFRQFKRPQKIYPRWGHFF